MRDRDEILTQQEAASHIAELAVYGYRGQDLANVIRAGMTREAAADALIALQRQAPKRAEA